MKKTASLFPALLLSAVFVFGGGQKTEEAGNLSLARAVEIALAGHPDVLVARQEIKAASARRRQMEARPDPSLTLGLDGIPWTFKSEDAAGGATEYSLGLDKKFEFPGRRAARIEIAGLDEDAASAEAERIGLLVAGQVRTAYHRAVLAEQTLSALGSLVRLLDQFQEAITVRYESGETPYADLLRARVEKARLQNRTIEARREQTAARTELFLLLGLAPESPVRLTDSLDFQPMTAALDQILAEALANRPSARLARLRQARAEAESRQAALARKPDFQAGFFLPSKNIRNWGFSFGLDLPLSRARSEGLRAEAASVTEKSLIQAAASSRRLEARISAAFAAARSAGEQVRIFEQKLLGEIEAEIQNGLEQYRFGRMKAFDLVDLFRSLSEARLEHLNALALYADALAGIETAGEEY